MSPQFFLLVVELFRKIIDGYKRNGNMKGVIMGKGWPLSHLLIFDNFLSFGSESFTPFDF